MKSVTEIPVRPCLRSGYCCRKAVCPFGTWDAAAHRCVHLQVTGSIGGADLHACAIKAEIEGRPGAEWSPAFGSGCSSALFNDARDRIAAALSLEIRHRTSNDQDQPRGPAESASSAAGSNVA